jgi:hypothetical protein
MQQPMSSVAVQVPLICMLAWYPTTRMLLLKLNIQLEKIIVVH